MGIQASPAPPDDERAPHDGRRAGDDDGRDDDLDAWVKDLVDRLPPATDEQTARQQAELVRMRASGEYSIADLMEMFSIGRATVYRALERAGRGRVGETA